jgi:cell division protein FtsB
VGKLLRFPRRGKKDLKTRPLFPGLIPGTDARPAGFASDASAAAIGARAATDEELLRKLKRRRTSVAALVAAVFTAGLLLALFGDRGYFDVRRQRALLKAQTAAVAAHQEYVQGLKRSVDRLKEDPRAIERIAREDLGYAEKNEIVLVVPDRLDETSRSAIVPVVSPAP